MNMFIFNPQPFSSSAIVAVLVLVKYIQYILRCCVQHKRYKKYQRSRYPEKLHPAKDRKTFNTFQHEGCEEPGVFYIYADLYGRIYCIGQEVPPANV